ncbi:MAG: hypothetical protein ACRDNZ_17705 [Streptosporangiaceae bacterium]
MSGQVIARGVYEGLSWEVTARRHSPERLIPKPGCLNTRIVVTDGERTVNGGGGSGYLPSPDRLLRVTTSQAPEGPYVVMATVHPSVARVELLVMGGEVIPMPVYDDASFPEARFAVCLLPRDIRLDCVRVCDARGIERERFDLVRRRTIRNSGI